MRMRIGQRSKNGLMAVGALLAGTAILRWSQAVAGGVSRGLSIFSTVLIPSLFPFLVLAGFLTRSGASTAIGRRTEWLTRRVFGLPGCCAAGIFMGAVGGYPAGSAVVGELVRDGRLSRAEGRRMLRFCVNGGPGFVISAVGVGLFGSVRLGMLLFAAQLLTSLVIGVMSAPRGSRRYTGVSIRRPSKKLSPTAALVESVTAACEALLYMGGFVVLFAAVMAWAEASGVTMWLGRGTVTGERCWSAVLACVLEVSSGCAAAAALPEHAVLLTAFAIGFGGISVHCQVASQLRGLALVDRGFFAARLMQGALTAVLAQLLLRYIPRTQAVVGGMPAVSVRVFSGSAAVSAALLVLGGVWLLTVGRLDKTA